MLPESTLIDCAMARVRFRSATIVVASLSIVRATPRIPEPGPTVVRIVFAVELIWPAVFSMLLPSVLICLAVVLISSATALIDVAELLIEVAVVLTVPAVELIDVASELIDVASSLMD